MKNRILLLLAALSCGSAAFSQIHLMERVDSSKVARQYDLNPVVVTGSGHHQRLKSTATPVRVLSKKEFQEQGITTFEDALVRMLPQASMMPNSMGNFLQLNGLGNKYILLLVNGQRVGDASVGVDLQRINMERVKRIEILDGAASSLYGSDAIGGVINIITDQPTNQMCSVTSATNVSGKGKLTEGETLDIYKKGFGSYTSFTHDRADSYQTYTEKYKSGTQGETVPTIAPFFTGYRTNLVSQRFTYSPMRRLALNADFAYDYKITDRPDKHPTIDGGQEYEMRYKGLRWGVGGIYKFDARNSIQTDVTVDRFRYGKEYDVATTKNSVGDYIQSKKQRTIEKQTKAILAVIPQGTTIIGSDWRLDMLEATSGNINQESYLLAYYAQHEQRFLDHFTATVGARFDYHKDFGDHFSPKASLMGSFGNVNVRATYSAGFRAPGLDELYYHNYMVNRGKPQIIFGNRDLTPEKSHYFSLNAEYRTHDLAVSVTGFINSIQDMIVRKEIDVTPTTLAQLQQEFPEMTASEAQDLARYSIYQNSDRGDVKGVQVNVSANVLEGLNVSANYVYTYARTKTGDEWTVLDRSIRNAATMAVNYHKAWGRYALNVNLNGRLQSKTYFSAYEDAPGFGLWNLQTKHTFDLGKHLLVEPSLGIDNIFNKTDNRIYSSKVRYALYTPGRMLTAGLRLKF